MELHLKRWQVRGLALVIGVGSVFTAIIDRNVLPLWVTLFAALFLAASLIQAVEPVQRVFLRRLVMATLILFVSVGAFNYVVNPFGLYPLHVFDPIVLTSRNLKMDWYKAYSPPPEAVVLGSSRSFTVDPMQIEALWHDSAFNASLTGGSIQDYLAFLRYIAQVGKLPRLIIINLAPEAFGLIDSRNIEEPNALLWDYVDHTDPAYALKNSFDRFSRLISKEQTETSIRLLQTKISNQPVFYLYTFETNGMGRFNATNLGTDVLDPDKLAFNPWVMRFSAFHPDSYRFDQLQQILELAKAQHMQVIGYMPPYHPAMHAVIVKQTAIKAIVDYITGHLDQFEKEYPFHYMNFIDSDAFSDGDAMFYDIIHPSVKASALMMQQLYDQFHSDVKTS